MVHRVAPARPETEFQRYDRNNRISPEFLEENILKALAAGSRFVSLDEFLNKRHRGESDPHDIVMTIDDGYKDIYQYAWPVFEKHRVPFTFYVASDFIEFGFDKCRRPELEGGQLAMDIIYKYEGFYFGGRNYPAQDLAGKAKCFDDLWKFFKRYKKFHPWASGKELLNKLLAGHELDFEGYRRRFVCTPNELKEMAASPLCTIGSHGKSHRPLDKIFWKSNLQREFAYSKAYLEKIVGKPVVHFSYPYGNYCKRLDKPAKEYYRSAVAVANSLGKFGAEVGADDSDYCLPRIMLKQDGLQRED